jgi:hypothetical protein
MGRLAGFLPPYVSTRTTVGCLTILLALMAALSSVSLGFEISEIRLLSKIQANLQLDDELVRAHSLVREVLAASSGALAATIALTFIAFLHRSRINARAFGSRRFRFSRVWVLIGFLIPGLNLIRPFQVTSEIWKASDPRATESPVAWKTVRVPRLVSAWWGMLIISVSLELLVIALTNGSGATIESLWTARWVGATAALATAVTAVLTCVLVLGIERAQTQKWSLLNRSIAPPDANRSRTEPAETALGPAAADSI